MENKNRFFSSLHVSWGKSNGCPGALHIAMCQREWKRAALQDEEQDSDVVFLKMTKKWHSSRIIVFKWIQLITKYIGSKLKLRKV
jgi:hypothetical protein